MQNHENVLDCYNKTASAYAAKYGDELAHKHLDTLLLKAFAEENKAEPKWLDLGCGPGQTTRFLHDLGITGITGTDLSPNMISEAKKLHPSIHFETADMLQLPYADNSFGAAVAFYAIVHFSIEQVLLALHEIKRVLEPGGQLLFSFHVGNEVNHFDNFLGEQVDISFYFFETAKIIEILLAAGFSIIDIIERQPYADTEYPSKRAYCWVQVL